MTIKAYKALSARVLVVATVNEHVGDWASYIDAVPGQCHELEFEEVAHTGAKVSKDLATLLFPTIAEKYRWRY